MKRLCFYLFSFITGLLLFLVIGLSLLFYTQAGRVWIAQTALELALGDLDYQITWQGLQSPEANYWIIEELGLSNGESNLINISGLKLHWWPATLLGGEIIIEDLLIEELDVNGTEELQLSGPGELRTSENEVRKGAIPVNIHTFTVESLNLAPAEPDRIPQLRLSGDLVMFRNDLVLSVNSSVKPSREETFNFNVSARVGYDSSTVVNGWYSEQRDSAITTALRLPHGEPFETSFRLRVTPTVSGYYIDIEDLAFLFHQHEVSAQGSVRQDGESWTLDQLLIDIDESRHTITGTVTDRQLDLELELKDFPNEIISVWTDYSLNGTSSGRFNINGVFADPLVTGSITSDILYRDKPVAIEISGQADKKRLSIQEGSITGTDQLSINLQESWIDLTGEEISLNMDLANIAMQTVRELGMEVPEGLNGMINLKAGVSGPMRSPEIDLDGRFSGNFRDQVPLTLYIKGYTEPFESSLPLTEEDTPPVYDTNITEFDLSIDEYRVNGEGYLSIQSSPLFITVNNILFKLADSSHSMDGTIEEDRIALNLSIKKLPLDIISIFTESEITGTASADFFLGGTFAEPLMTGSLESDVTYESVPIHLRTRFDASREWIELERMVVDADGDAITIDGNLDLVGKNSSLDIVSRDLDLSLLRRFGIAFPDSVNGLLNAELTVTGSRDLPGFSGEADIVGNYQDIPVTVNISGRGNKNRFAIEELKLNTPDNGFLLLQGEYENNYGEFILEGRDIPADLLRTSNWHLPEGVLNGEIKASGNPDNPRARGKISYSQKNTTANTTLPGSGIDAELNLSDNQLDAELTLAGEGARTGKVIFSLPWRRYLHGNTELTLEQLPLSGRVRAEAYLQELCLLLVDQDIHTCRGYLTADLTLGDTLLSPDITGQFQLADGFYENIVSGTNLHDLKVNVKATGKGFEIIEAVAGDGEQGRIILEGKGQWFESLKDNKIDLVLSTNNSHLLRRYDMDGTANGSLSLSGDHKELELSGTLEINPFTMALDIFFQDSIPVLEIKNDNRQIHRQTASREKWRLLPVVRLDIELKADKQAFLRGPELEAELQGMLNIRGTYTEPIYSANFRTVRGRMDILGKRFDLVEGELNLNNDIVSILIPAVYSGKEMEIRAELFGTSDDLKLALSSSPPYPEDEIISQLLFGKSSQHISPLQAMRLANAITMFKRSGRPLFDPLARIEKTLSIDRLTLEENSDSNGMLLGVGKYINEKVYIEVERGTGAGETWQGNLEIELRPNLSLENTINSESGFGNIGLQWKKDY